MDQKQEKGFTPPYISFTTLQTFLDRQEAAALPPQIDRSYIRWLSGTQQAQMLATLKQLGLIKGEKGEVQPALVELVRTKADERKAVLRGIIARYYAWVDPLNAANATIGQLEDAFREHNIGGDTLRKAIAFYVQAATYAAVPLSVNFKGRKSSAPRTGARRAGRPRKQEEERPEHLNNGQSTPTSTEALRLKYIEMLMKKAEEKDEPELLDRIEKLLAASTKEAE